jgi:PGF-pre-PGF domain-containing protein
MYFKYALENTITNSRIENNSQAGFSFLTDDWYIDNSFYNNIINNSMNTLLILSNTVLNSFNTTLTSGTNIVGGPNIGGNYWAYPNGTGFSENCTDSDENGICDEEYLVYTGFFGDIYDYLPLADSPFITCNSCSDCSTKIQSASSGDIIKLTQDISDYSGTCINFGSSIKNITFDCQGNTIDGDGTESSHGITIERSSETSNLTIQNCIITGFELGMRISGSANNTLRNNNMSNNLVRDFYFSPSSGMFYINYQDYENDIDTSNIINYNKIIYYNYSASDYVFDPITAPDAGVVYCTYCNNITYKDLDLSGEKMQLSYFTNSTLQNITVSNGEGISLEFSDNNTLTNITANSNTQYGVYLFASDNNTLTNITANSNTQYGIRLFSSLSGNLIKDSRIENNTDGGISFEDFFGMPLTNFIYNNLFNNTLNIKFISSSPEYINSFNTTLTLETNIVDGPNIGGNYWAYPDGTGFSETCTDTGGDGICDDTTLIYTTSHDEPVYDYLPLADYSDSTGPTISITYPTATSYTSVTSLNYTVSDLSGVDYCWYSLDSGVTNSTPDSSCENVTLTSPAVGSHTWTVYANDSLGNENSSSVSFTISSPVVDGGSSGGGSSSSSDDDETEEGEIEIGTLSSNSQRIIFVNEENLDLYKLVVYTKNAISQASFSISEINKLNLGLSIENIYQAFEINKTGFVNEDISNVTFEFKVNKSWVGEKDVKKIILQRKEDDSNEWKILKTNLFDEDEKYYYFNAISPGFSAFAIYFDEEVCDVGDLVCVEGNLHLCTSDRVLLLVQKCEFDCKYGRCIENYDLDTKLEEDENVFQRFLKIVSNLRVNLGNVFFFAIIGFISVFFIIMFYLILRNKRKSKVKEDLNFN